MPIHELFVSTRGVRRLIRDALKCGCPESVFDDVRIGLPTLYNTHGVPGGLEILVGNRLLVAVIPLQGLMNPESDIPAILERGRRVRDDNGFNRFRLVLVDARDAQHPLRFDAMAAAPDDRSHVHLLDDQELKSCME